MTDKNIYKYPASRVATHDIGILSRKKHHVTGLLEVDITQGRRELKELLQQGFNVSFTAWLVKEISKAIEDNPDIHALNASRRRQIVFQNVNISVPIEKTINGRKVPIVKLIVDTNKKTIEEICSELTESRERHVNNERDYTFTSKWYTRLNFLFFHMPQFLRIMIWRILLMSPQLVQNNIGTAIITNAGVVGTTPGWIIPTTIHNLSFGIGSIVKKPRILNGEIMIREILHLTLLIDHDAVDGLPAAKFTSKLINNIENATQLRVLQSTIS